MMIKLILGMAAALMVAFASAETIHGKVVAITDGDSITLLDQSKVQHKIRLSGIDAPEKKQAFGQRSKESLSELIFGFDVAVETTKVDRYGRQIGKIHREAMDVNLEQIKRGLAWHYKAYEREQSHEDRSLYATAENDARSSKIGLWRDDDPVAPWDFRHRGK